MVILLMFRVVLDLRAHVEFLAAPCHARPIRHTDLVHPVYKHGS